MENEEKENQGKLFNYNEFLKEFYEGKCDVEIPFYTFTLGELRYLKELVRIGLDVKKEYSDSSDPFTDIKIVQYTVLLDKINRLIDKFNKGLDK